MPQIILTLGRIPSIVVTSVEVGNDAYSEIDDMKATAEKHNCSFSAIWDNTAVNGENLPFQPDLQDFPNSFDIYSAGS